MARLGGFEPSTTRLEGVCSIHTELQAHYLHYRLFIEFKTLTIWKPTNILSTASSGNTVAVKVSYLTTSNEALSLLIMTLVTWTMLGVAVTWQVAYAFGLSTDVTVIVVSPTATAVTFPSSTVATVSLSEV